MMGTMAALIIVGAADDVMPMVGGGVDQADGDMGRSAQAGTL